MVWRRLNRLCIGLARTKDRMEKLGFSQRTRIFIVNVLFKQLSVFYSAPWHKTCTQNDWLVGNNPAMNVAQHWARTF